MPRDLAIMPMAFTPVGSDNGTDQISGCLVYDDIKHQLLGDDPDEKM